MLKSLTLEAVGGDDADAALAHRARAAWGIGSTGQIRSNAVTAIAAVMIVVGMRIFLRGSGAQGRGGDSGNGDSNEEGGKVHLHFGREIAEKLE
ncbi:hypothetical protein HDU83_009221 [Entophlyctis luteolus]|nr:hypothetical protein HDU83_009221 [Entophlyctis luteolus]